MLGFVLRNLMAAFGKILVVEVLHVSGTIIKWPHLTHNEWGRPWKKPSDKTNYNWLIVFSDPSHRINVLINLLWAEEFQINRTYFCMKIAMVLEPVPGFETDCRYRNPIMEVKTNSCEKLPWTDCFSPSLPWQCLYPCHKQTSFSGCYYLLHINWTLNLIPSNWKFTVVQKSG